MIREWKITLEGVTQIQELKTTSEAEIKIPEDSHRQTTSSIDLIFIVGIEQMH